MVVYYGIEKRQEDGSWKLDAWDCGTPVKFRSEEEADTCARWHSPLFDAVKDIMTKTIESAGVKANEGDARFSNALYWTSNKMIDLLREYKAELDWRVVEVERHEDWHSTPLGDVVERLEGDIFEGSWDCKDSPTKKCHFNVVEDPACDQCLYCGEPEERR